MVLSSSIETIVRDGGRLARRLRPAPGAAREHALRRAAGDGLARADLGRVPADGLPFWQGIGVRRCRGGRRPRPRLGPSHCSARGRAWSAARVARGARVSRPPASGVTRSTARSCSGCAATVARWCRRCSSPLSLAALQTFQPARALVSVKSGWSAICGLAILFGTYFPADARAAIAGLGRHRAVDRADLAARAREPAESEGEAVVGPRDPRRRLRARLCRMERSETPRRHPRGLRDVVGVRTIARREDRGRWPQSPSSSGEQERNPGRATLGGTARHVCFCLWRADAAMEPGDHRRRLFGDDGRRDVAELPASACLTSPTPGPRCCRRRRR